MAWLGLGIARLNLGMHAEAEEALNLSKIYNPLSEETQQYQAQVDQHYRESLESQYKYAREPPLAA